MSEELYHEPNRKAQIRNFYFFAFCIAFPVLIKFLLPNIAPGSNATAEEREIFMVFLKYFMIGIYVIYVIYLLHLAISMFRMGYCSLKLERYPPPDAILPFRARIYKGKQAISWSYISIALGFLIGLFAILQNFYVIPFFQETFNYSFGSY